MVPWVVLVLATLTYGGFLSRLAGRLRPLSLQGQVLQRKLFHMGVFTGAVAPHYFLGFWGVVLYGVTIGGWVLVAAFRGKGSLLFRVLLREGEAEGRGEILIPLVSTALGGILGVLLVGEFAMVGYLVCGWGDAAGEIVGRQWGRHPFSQLLPSWMDSSRTVEGSIGVFALGCLGGWAALGLLGFQVLPALAVGLFVGAVAAVSELLSWRGTDNLWVQLLPSLCAWWLLG